eukprot:GHVN01032641.1.p1 GENE.GHVN01032641.1~~GHVN01032641.1.p1  ORF type:complete len:160 (-),score=76.50 GHVN01032641.1:140-619(-)
MISDMNSPSSPHSTLFTSLNSLHLTQLSSPHSTLFASRNSLHLTQRSSPHSTLFTSFNSLHLTQIVSPHSTLLISLISLHLTQHLSSHPTLFTSIRVRSDANSLVKLNFPHNFVFDVMGLVPKKLVVQLQSSCLQHLLHRFHILHIHASGYSSAIDKLR